MTNIPHPLDGCRAKLARALELINLLELESVKYLTQEPPIFKVEHEYRNNGLEYALVAYGEPEPPIRFSVISGEIIHHMRSSLDHLITAIVIHNGKTPTKFNQFPICITAKEFKDACKRRQLDGVSHSAKKIIESVQPYTTPTPDDTILNVIREYDNADKHRLLVVVATAVHLGHEVTLNSDGNGKTTEIVGFGDFEQKKLSKSGSTIFSVQFANPTKGVSVNGDVTPQLALDQCGRLKLFPLISALRNLLQGTQHTIELFTNEFAN